MTHKNAMLFRQVINVQINHTLIIYQIPLIVLYKQIIIAILENIPGDN